jgi:hypothetical protein
MTDDGRPLADYMCLFLLLRSFNSFIFRLAARAVNQTPSNKHFGVQSKIRNPKSNIAICLSSLPLPSSEALLHPPPAIALVLCRLIFVLRLLPPYTVSFTVSQEKK